ncbi:MAG: hypothetical protein IJ587_04830 [Synergistaceae bacterium]|nr:hypothetical protein [Synergistaceae bacterium]
MSKIITTLVMFLMMVGVSFGAVSEDMSVYVHKDVFEVYMQNVNSKFDTIMEELKEQRKTLNEISERLAGLSERIDSVNNSLSERINGVNTSLSGRIDGLDKRIDDLRNGIYLWLVAIGLVVAWPKLLDKLHSWGKSAPSLTLEDVKRLIEEQIAKNNEELLRNLKA